MPIQKPSPDPTPSFGVRNLNSLRTEWYGLFIDADDHPGIVAFDTENSNIVLCGSSCARFDEFDPLEIDGNRLKLKLKRERRPLIWFNFSEEIKTEVQDFVTRLNARMAKGDGGA